jgi:YggT family protein
MSIIVNSIIDLILLFINIYVWVIIIAALLSFVNPDPRNQIVQIIRNLTEPVFYYVRRKLPFVVVSGIDLSPILIIFVLNIISQFLYKLHM